LGHEIDDQGTTAATIDEIETLIDEISTVTSTPVLSGIRLPVGFTKIDKEPECAYTRLITRMAHKKGLDYEDFVNAGVGFTRDDPLWEPYAIFPIIEFGRVVYYQGRTYGTPPDGKTKRFPSKAQYGSKYWVYNIDAVRKTQAGVIVIIVESILNVLSLQKLINDMGHTNIIPLAIFKHSVSVPQGKKIMACKNIEEICFMYDSDFWAHGFKDAQNMANFKKVTVSHMPNHSSGKKQDPNDDPSEAWKAFLSRKSSGPIDSLLQQHGLD